MKRILHSLLLCLLVHCIEAQTVSAPQGPLGAALSDPASWNGSYRGTISGTSAVMTIQTHQDQIEGQIDASGYLYQLSGTFKQQQSSGILTDKITGGAMEFTAQLTNEIVDMKLKIVDQYGQTTEFPLQFERADAKPSSSQQSAGTAARNDVRLDPSLIGGWRYTKAYTSEEFGTVSETYMNIMQDGTYTYGDSQIAGGDEGSTFYSGGNSGHTTGRWKSENGMVFINEGYGWEKYASYYVDGNSMLFTFEDGTKQLWERYR